LFAGRYSHGAKTLSAIPSNPANVAHDREEIFLDVNFSSYRY
jgi:hypothetical protein